jgi:hypothetical protein
MDLASAATSRAREAFAAHLGGAALVGPAPVLDARHGWSYQTASRRIVADPSSGETFVLHDDDVVFALRKAAGAAFADTILIGRAASNDVCIEHTSVSKLHARIQQQGGGRWLISDAGSHNGTHINERPLREDEHLELKDGDQVRFGACQLRFVSAERLHDLLNRLYGGPA